MCGIAGYLSFNRMEGNGRKLKKMSELISHRGPDDEGFILINRIKRNFIELSSKDSHRNLRSKFADIESGQSIFRHDLGMSQRRFSIIDLSHLGHQPMSDSEKTVFIVLNGEIFNYIELREELKNRGIIFRSGSDTEVVIESYKFWGIEFINKLSGFWAFSLYDLKNDILLLSRDRIGKKPIYFYRNNHQIMWASEIKSLLKFIDRSSLSTNEETVMQYLLTGIKDHGHTTFWKDIRMLDNSSVMVFNLGEKKEYQNRFWDIPKVRNNASKTNLENSVSLFRSKLKLALNERLRADVPIAFELSGGLDSSSLVALRAEISKERFPVFTVKYDDPKIDESSFAIALTKKYPNIDHHIINFQNEDLFKYLDEFNLLMEEPFHGPVLLIGQLLRKKISNRGFKVIIGGAGGDEVFGGYTEYAIPILRELKKEGKYYDILKNILFYKEKYPLSLFPLLSLIFRKAFGIGYRASFQKRYINDPDRILKTIQNIGLPKNANELFVKNMEDLKMYYWMSSNDKSDMGIPVEVRNPFLDYRIVDLIFSLPLNYLFRNGWLKWFLRRSFVKDLPESILWRKRKQGFPFPISGWLSYNSKKLKDILNDGDDKWIKVDDIIRNYDSIRLKDPAFLWRLINLQLWDNKFNRDSGDFFRRDN